MMEILYSIRILQCIVLIAAVVGAYFSVRMYIELKKLEKILKEGGYL